MILPKLRKYQRPPVGVKLSTEGRQIAAALKAAGYKVRKVPQKPRWLVNGEYLVMWLETSESWTVMPQQKDLLKIVREVISEETP